MSAVSAVYVGRICLPYMSALYVCLKCLLYMSALRPSDSGLLRVLLVNAGLTQECVACVSLLEYRAACPSIGDTHATYRDTHKDTYVILHTPTQACRACEGCP